LNHEQKLRVIYSICKIMLVYNQICINDVVHLWMCANIDIVSINIIVQQL